jgi:hypothetical protein
MFAAADPNLIVGEFAVDGLALYLLWRLIVWVRDSPTRPDPWDAETEQKLSETETPEICPHCSTPQQSCAWFCENCGRAVGPYNNLMPYVQIFSQGEVLRNGTSGQFRKRPLILTGFFLIGLGMLPFFLLPVYWFSLLLNFKRPDKSSESVPRAVP